MWNQLTVATKFSACASYIIMCPYLSAEYNATAVLPMTRNDVCYLCSTNSSGENVMLFTQEVQPGRFGLSHFQQQRGTENCTGITCRCTLHLCYCLHRQICKLSVKLDVWVSTAQRRWQQGEKELCLCSDLRPTLDRRITATHATYPERNSFSHITLCAWSPFSLLPFPLTSQVSYCKFHKSHLLTNTYCTIHLEITTLMTKTCTVSICRVASSF